jgi:hypothetical protein
MNVRNAKAMMRKQVGTVLRRNWSFFMQRLSRATCFSALALTLKDRVVSDCFKGKEEFWK